jgi:hypothetical protein
MLLATFNVSLVDLFLLAQEEKERERARSIVNLCIMLQKGKKKTTRAGFEPTPPKRIDF